MCTGVLNPGQSFCNGNNTFNSVLAWHAEENEELMMEDAAEPADAFAATPSAAAAEPMEGSAAAAETQPPRPKRSISQLRSKIETAVEAHAAREARANREIEQLQRISNGSWEAGKPHQNTHITCVGKAVPSSAKYVHPTHNIGWLLTDCAAHIQ